MDKKGATLESQMKTWNLSMATMVSLACAVIDVKLQPWQG